jgi:hypothetical protein
MLRIIESFNNLPVTIEPDPDANFQPGQIGSLRIKNSKSIIGICDGLHPFGIIDDIRSHVSRALPNPYSQVHIVPIQIAFDEEKQDMVSASDAKVELNYSKIIIGSFTSNIPGQLHSVNGVFTIPKGTKCNYCLTPQAGSEPDINNAIRLVCTYAYNVHYPELQDSVSVFNRVTIWSKNMIAETDMFDTTQKYFKYSNLFVQNGFLTTNRADYTCKCIGVVLQPPGIENSMLRFLLDLEGKVDIGVSSWSKELNTLSNR